MTKYTLQQRENKKNKCDISKNIILNVKLIFNFSFNFLIKNIKICQNYKYIDISNKKYEKEATKYTNVHNLKEECFGKDRWTSLVFFSKLLYLLKFETNSNSQLIKLKIRMWSCHYGNVGKIK